MQSVNNRQFEPDAQSMRRPRDKSVTKDDLSDTSPRTDGDSAQLVRVLRDASLPDVLAGELEALIVRGDLSPGDRINEAQLARQYGVSRGPLRAALGTLAAQGLVVQYKNRGSFVRQVGAREADEIYALRNLLESSALASFELLEDSEQQATLAQLDGVLDAMQVAVTTTDSRRYFELNLVFHEIVIAMHHNEKMLLMYRALVRDLVLARRQKLRTPKSLEISIAEHRGIVLALREKNVPLARQRITEHAETGRLRTHSTQGPQQ
jgi:DNA-binding GntR family transcriptional regulator